MIILGIETSCDETAAAVVTQSATGMVRVLGEAVASSQDMHAETGGIVPEVAAREQLVSMVPVIEYSLRQAYLQSTNNLQPSLPELITWAQNTIDHIAYTKEPGLIGSLLIGIETAKTLALAWNKPLKPINHLHGHIFANWIETETYLNPPDFPALALIVSGGHTELVLLTKPNELTTVGSTRDDAAGECLDKCARLLDLPYPGGKFISEWAQQYDSTHQLPFAPLPCPLLYQDTLDMSFSGLKAAFARTVQAHTPLSEEIKVALAYDLGQTVVTVLVSKLTKAMLQYQPQSVLLAGGVAANSLLRAEVEKSLTETSSKLFIPPVKYCMDNAAMIGAAAIKKGGYGYI